MASKEHKSNDIPSILFAATAILVAVTWGIQGIARQAEVYGPHVGDIVSFEPAHRAPFKSTARLTVARPDQSTCVLDAAFLQTSGGSLVLDQLETAPTRLYQAHWAGPRTSPDASDCGGDAELTLMPADLAALTAAAGGLGVHTAG